MFGVAVSIEEIKSKAAGSYEVFPEIGDSVKPVVSVRTSAYNHAPFIRQCIEGVLMQKTNFEFEYIIGEDCSTDVTREIILEYAQKYPDKIRVITAEKNIGATANAYRCMKAVKGKYIAMCEGDDFWIDEYKLQKQFDHMESHPECAICSTMGIERSHLDSSLADVIKPLSGAGSYSHGWFLNGRTGMLTASIFYRAEHYRPEVSYNSKILIGDWALLVSLTEGGRTCDVLPCISVVYRQHAGGVWSSRKKDPVFKLNSQKVAFQEYLKVAPSQDHSALQSHIELLDVKVRFLSYGGSRWSALYGLLGSPAGRRFFWEIGLKKWKSLF